MGTPKPGYSAFVERKCHSCSYCSQIVFMISETSTEVRRKSRSDTECRFTFAEVVAGCACPLFKEGYARLSKLKHIGYYSPEELHASFSLIFYITPEDNKFTFLEFQWQHDERWNEDAEFDPDTIHLLGLINCMISVSIKVPVLIIAQQVQLRHSNISSDLSTCIRGRPRHSTSSIAGPAAAGPHTLNVKKQEKGNGVRPEDLGCYQDDY